MASGRTEYLNDPEAPKPNSLVPAAGILAVDPDGRVLLQRRRDTGQWAIPMGKQEIGETVTQCAERETHEETGVTVKVTGLLGIFSHPGHVVLYHSNGETRQEYEIIFLGEPVFGEPAANDEASAAGWYTRAELPGLDIHPSQRRQLGHWMNGTYPHYD
jgi:8-oxo-dGTP pyrophosphatase MutT (NUDIX family)